MRNAFLAVSFLIALPVSAARLPQTVVPSHYRIAFTPDLATATFTGDETIDVDVRQPSKSVTLNAAEIEFGDVTITGGGKSQNATVELHPDDDTATLSVGDAVSGAASIAIHYRGILNDKLRGFYLSRTPRRKYAVTQFEATDARRAFPSFDEPAFKATFDVAAVVDSGDTAISNGSIVSDKPGPGAGKHTISFSQTKRISTYLVALVVGDFVCSTGNAGDVPIRVCSTPDKLQLTRYAVGAAAKELEFYNDYYGIKYPFGKLDIIGVPDFSAGAMENAAAITFRESALLVDEATGSATQKERVASVIAHELAHQWFGDLVTMSWWDDVWLNEGFATWMTPKAITSVDPSFSSPVSLAQSTSRALNVDMTASTRAIRTHAETPQQIDALFDRIAYDKTAAVLRMVEAYIGADLYRDGIRAYLRKFSYGNASAEDFWGTMASATKQPLDRIFSSYVLQAGEPLVAVATKCENGSTLVTMSQRRFFENAQTLAAGSKEWWSIPMVAHVLGGGIEHFLLDDRTHTFTVAQCSPAIFFNANGWGYYRTEYAAGVLPAPAKLGQSLSLAEKVSLLSDEWALVHAGERKVGEYLALANAFLAGREPSVVTSALPSLESIGRDLTTAADRATYNAWVRSVLTPIQKDVGLTARIDDGPEVLELRAALLVALSHAGDPAVAAQAKELAPKIMENRSGLDRQVGAVLLAIAARNGDAAFYDQIRAKLAAARTPEDYRMYVAALASFIDPVLVQRSIDFAMSPEMRSQDRTIFLNSLMANPDTRAVAWPYMREHWPEVEKALPPFTSTRASYALSTVCTPEARDEMQAFFKAHPSISERTARAAVERINDCIAFHELQAANLSSYLGGLK